MITRQARGTNQTVAVDSKLSGGWLKAAKTCTDGTKPQYSRSIFDNLTYRARWAFTEYGEAFRLRIEEVETVVRADPQRAPMIDESRADTIAT